MNETETPDPRTPEFWEHRYQSGHTPWDMGRCPPEMTDLAERLTAGRVLVPGCGTGHELVPFVESGWEVVALDISAKAVADLREKMGEQVQCWHADFFQAPFADGSFDLICERRFLCSLPPEKRGAYAQTVGRLIKPGGLLAGIFDIGEEPEPPPWPISFEALHELLDGDFQLRERATHHMGGPFAEREYWMVWERR